MNLTRWIEQEAKFNGGPKWIRTLTVKDQSITIAIAKIRLMGKIDGLRWMIFYQDKRTSEIKYSVSLSAAKVRATAMLKQDYTKFLEKEMFRTW